MSQHQVGEWGLTKAFCSAAFYNHFCGDINVGGDCDQAYWSWSDYTSL